MKQEYIKPASSFFYSPFISSDKLLSAYCYKINSSHKLLHNQNFGYICETNNPKLLSMKASLFYTGLISLCSMIFSSCGVGIPIQNKAPQNNDTYTISYLFEHDGVKVYRFYDMGNYVYFTTKGEVTSINNDSTTQRTIVVPKDNLIIAPKETGK